MTTLFQRIRRVFFTGLFVCLPLIITVLVFKFAFNTIDSFLGPMVSGLLSDAGFPIEKGSQIPGLGIITTIILILLIGIITRNYIGKKLWDLGERLFASIPGISLVYTTVKQVLDTFKAGNLQNFSKVVMIEYPRKGIYCLAFITGSTEGEISNRLDEDLINIFLPTTPNPTSGFFLVIPRSNVVELDMTVEEGIKMIVSGGIVTPTHKVDIKGSNAKETT